MKSQYTAPELLGKNLSKNENVIQLITKKCDIFSLGVIMY